MDIQHATVNEFLGGEIMATKKKTLNKETTVYIGPSLPGLVRHTVFVGGVLPTHVSEMVAKNQRIGGLIVPLSELQQARKDIKKKGHILNHFLTHLYEKE